MVSPNFASAKKLLVIGDAMHDVYVYGTLHPCQDGCQKFVEETRVTVPGGVANAARSISNWPCIVLQGSMDVIPVKTRFIANDRIVFRHDKDAVSGTDNYRQQVLKLVPLVDGVLISDYDKGALDTATMREIIGMCKKYGLPCVADMKRPPELYEGAIRKCNYEYGLKYANVFDVVTDGDGPPFVRGKRISERWCNVPLINHVGAGDCFAAHLLLALINGCSLHDAAAFAHSAGRVYVQHRHNRPPMPAEVLAR